MKILKQIIEISNIKSYTTTFLTNIVFVLEYEPNKSNFIHGKTPQISLVFCCFLNGDDKIKPPSVPDIDPNNLEISSEAKWVQISDLEGINYVPYIHEQLMEYI